MGLKTDIYNAFIKSMGGEEDLSQVQTDNVETLAKFRGNQCGLKYAEAFNVLKLVNV